MHVDFYHTKMNKMFCNILVYSTRLSCDKSSKKTSEILTMFGNLVLACELTRCTLPPSMWDLKGKQLNVHYSLLQEPMIYKFKVDHKAVEVSKNIFPFKGESASCDTIARCITG